MCFGICLITHACCGFHHGVCIHLCLFSLGSEPQLDSHLEGLACYTHKQDGSKLAAQKACGLEWCCPTPQLHYWAMLMMQALLIYSLFNTISLALVPDLAGLTLQQALSFWISTLKKKKKTKGKKHIPSGSGTLHSDSCWLTLSLKVLVSTAAPPGFNKQWSRGCVCVCAWFVYMHGCLYVCQFERWAGNETYAPSTTTTTTTTTGAAPLFTLANPERGRGAPKRALLLLIGH